MSFERKIVALPRLTGLFEGFLAKPDIIIDDMPDTVLKPLVFDVNSEPTWSAFAEEIIRKPID